MQKIRGILCCLLLHQTSSRFTSLSSVSYPKLTSQSPADSRSMDVPIPLHRATTALCCQSHCGCTGQGGPGRAQVKLLLTWGGTNFLFSKAQIMIQQNQKGIQHLQIFGKITIRANKAETWCWSRAPCFSTSRQPALPALPSQPGTQRQCGLQAPESPFETVLHAAAYWFTTIAAPASHKKIQSNPVIL